jgi:DNA repair photolyase
VKIKEINAKSILRKQKKIESWFLTSYGMNLYRGCEHNCVYCDGRSEKYQVDGEFGCEVTVKTNAIDLLHRELDPTRKRTPFKGGYVGLGGGVGDSYQPVEKKYKLSRKALQLIHHYNLPVHILTKSTLVKRDIDIIKKINEKKRAIVSFSFSSANDRISSVFEPGVPPPSQRLETIDFFKKQGIACGMYLMPVIPFITDKPDIMEDTIKKAKNHGVDFIIFSGMTLKDGSQKDYFMNVLKKKYPDLVVDYNHIYHGDKWGNASWEYYNSISCTFDKIASRYRIPKRIPHFLYDDLLDENDRVIVILEHMDYLLKLRGSKSPYGFAAYSISKLNSPLSDIRDDLKSMKGVGVTTERIILEILDTGNCKYYEKLMNAE